VAGAARQSISAHNNADRILTARENIRIILTVQQFDARRRAEFRANLHCERRGRLLTYATMTLLNYALVALGGALGSVARFWLANAIAAHLDEKFPFGTLFVNVTGSFLIGALASYSPLDARHLRAFFMVGICGGYTTFSSFSLQNLQLMRDGNWPYATLNMAASLALCMIAVWLGFWAGAAIRR
jgi:CrcB protein